MWRAIRRFGLDHHDLPTMLWNVTTLLKFVTLDVDPRNKKPVGIFTYILVVALTSCYYYIYFVSMMWFVFVRCRETGDHTTAIIVFSVGTVSETCMAKLLALIAKRKCLRKLISDYLAWDAQEMMSKRYAANMKSMLRVVKKRAIILWNVIMWNGVAYALQNVYISGRHLIQGDFVFLGFRDIDQMKTSPYYEFIMTIDIAVILSICYGAGAVLTLFIVISGYIEAQLLACSQELTNVWEDALTHCNISSRDTQLDDSSNITLSNNFYATTSQLKGNSRRHNTSSISSEEKSEKRAKELNKFVRNRLAIIANNHSKNIDFINQTERVFQIATASEFIILSTGLVAILLGGLEHTYIEIPFTLMPMSINCYIGQRIKDAHKAFEEAAYYCKWENFDVPNRKMVLMMLTVSQKSVELTAGGIITLNFECLMAVLRKAYSIYAALRTTMM